MPCAQNPMVTLLDHKAQSPYHDVQVSTGSSTKLTFQIVLQFPSKSLHSQPYRKFSRLKPTKHHLVCSLFPYQSLEYFSPPVSSLPLHQNLAQILPFPKSFLDGHRQNDYSLFSISKPHCSHFNMSQNCFYPFFLYSKVSKLPTIRVRVSFEHFHNPQDLAQCLDHSRKLKDIY